jgi:Tfp pilus assembly protein PilX
MNRIARLATSARDRTLNGETAERGVAMLTAIFFMVIIAGLSVVLMSVALSQQAPTLNSQKSTKTIYSAQAGLQAALGVIRTAFGTTNAAGETLGAVEKLPCSLAGTVEGAGTGTSYQVAVDYFILDPSGKDAAWRASKRMSCTNGTGVVPQANGAGVLEKPKFAYIKATGIGVTLPGQVASFGNRSLSAVYKFKVNTENIAGGLMFANGRAQCLHAVSEAAGSEVQYIPAGSCTDFDKELWIYSTDYRIKLAHSTLNGAPGLCITGPAVDGQPTQNALLQPCKAANDPARWNQLWSWTNNWQGQKANITGGLSNYCLTPGASPNYSTDRVKVATTCSGTFEASPEVGAGAARKSTNQIVNYKEFGRCLDVTNENLNEAFMISYPCKQDATGTGVSLKWNHKWYYTEPTAGQQSLAGQQITVNYLDASPADTYCFQAPLSGGGADTTFARCNNSARQKWTRVYDSGDYASSYLFVDFLGRCLVADKTNTYNSWSKIRVAVCNGSLEQKWNAPPVYVDSDFGGYREVSE